MDIRNLNKDIIYSLKDREILFGLENISRYYLFEFKQKINDYSAISMQNKGIKISLVF